MATIHLSDDSLMQYALDLLDDDDREAVAAHLAGCEQCRTRLEIVRGDIAAIEQVEVTIPSPPLSFPVQRRTNAWAVLVRAVALILVGFVTGWYLSSQVRNTEVVSFAHQPPAVHPGKAIPGTFHVCEPIDLR